MNLNREKSACWLCRKMMNEVNPIIAIYTIRLITCARAFGDQPEKEFNLCAILSWYGESCVRAHGMVNPRIE